MKQDEIKTGESYLFANTDVEHRKNMIGAIVTVISKKQGNKKITTDGNGFTQKGKSPMRFKLSNGQYANAANLKPLPQSIEDSKNDIPDTVGGGFNG